MVNKYQLLIKHILESGVRYAPKQEIVYRDIHRYTYAEMYKRVNKLANALSNLGVRKGSRIAVLDWDSHRYLECYFAIPMMGAILHTVNARLSAEDMLYTIQHAEDDLILVHKDFVPLIESMKNKLSVKRYIIMTDDETPKTKLGDIEYEEMLKKANAHYEFPDFDENRTATIFYTTGTTGRPKGVRFTHRQLVLHTLAVGFTLAAYFDGVTFRCDDVYMPLTPMFHVHAWGYPYLATLLGVKQVYAGKYDAKMIVELIKKEKVTVSHCVPTILSMILSELKEGERLDGWKVNVGGSKLPKSLAMKARMRGIRVMGGYGMSETCPVLTLAKIKPEIIDLDEEAKNDYLIKAGIPIPFVYLRVINENWSDVKHGEMGEVIVRAPWLTSEYLKDEEKSKKLWRGGWMHTGDIGVVDECGYLTIVDRIKDIIKSGGEWISSLILEDLLGLHPKVKEVAVIGVPDEKWGERPVAVISPSEYLTKDEIRQHLLKFVEEGKIAKWMIPDEFVFIDEIPKTSVGKLNKRAIKDMLRIHFRQTSSTG